MAKRIFGSTGQTIQSLYFNQKGEQVDTPISLGPAKALSVKCVCVFVLCYCNGRNFLFKQIEFVFGCSNQLAIG